MNTQLKAIENTEELQGKKITFCYQTDKEFIFVTEDNHIGSMFSSGYYYSEDDFSTELNFTNGEALLSKLNGERNLTEEDELTRLREYLSENDLFNIAKYKITVSLNREKQKSDKAKNDKINLKTELLNAHKLLKEHTKGIAVQDMSKAEFIKWLDKEVG